MNKGESVVAIVACAGSGVRMGADKAMLKLGDKPLFAWPVDVLQDSGLIDAIVIVLHKDNMPAGERLVVERKWSKVMAVCEGGRLRQDSVRNGLAHTGKCEWVLIQDGARPFLTAKLIEDGLEAARETGAAIAAVPVTDTLKQADESNHVALTLDRRQIRAVQTPQVFSYDIIVEAYEKATGEVTDDAMLAEQAGYKVKMYMGNYNNIKVTRPEDMKLAEFIAAGR